MSHQSYDSPHSEANFMDDVSFDIEENLERPPQPQYQEVRYQQPPISQTLTPQQHLEKQPSAKKPSKISINLKPKLLPQTTEQDPIALHQQRLGDLENKWADEEIKDLRTEGGHKEDMVVPEFLKDLTRTNEASTSAIMRQVFPYRYFILKNLSRGLMEACMENNYCVILLAFKKKLHDAYQVKIPNNCIVDCACGVVCNFKCSLGLGKKIDLTVFCSSIRENPEGVSRILIY